MAVVGVTIECWKSEHLSDSCVALSYALVLLLTYSFVRL